MPPPPKQPTSTLDIIRGIRDGTIASGNISIETRRACVQRLKLEGCSHEEIADCLGVCAKTISRDMKAIRQDNSLQITPQLASELFGEYYALIETAITRFRRLDRDPNTPAATRVVALRAAPELFGQFIAHLHQVGLLSPVSADDADSEPALGSELIQVAHIVAEEFGVESPLGQAVRELIDPAGTSEPSRPKEPE